ncbi:probable multidrug resistance-associated protein lethal(2)03659 [Drosophila takahashii]|uniref:probable multidrug resistance-associated protein lethal(2)03659 n=1 Tax=Drosophila takahashii TaxID=29030 RepID=UPI001CF8E3FD|nr:probable multidrug resistance-associated protein lethal(2)03659 [Drosophila takahashii]
MQSLNSEDLPENPRERSNIFSVLSYWYTIPTFIKGRKVTLDTKDLYRALKEHKSEKLGNKLCSAWEAELETYQKDASLLRTLLRVFGWYFVFLGLVLFIVEAISTLQPVFLGKLISFFSHDTETIEPAYVYAALVILCTVLDVTIKHPYSFAVTHLGLKIRVGLTSLIYRKSLRLSKTALGEICAGHVINLISNDLGRVDTFIQFTHYLWLGPLQTLLVTYLMYQVIGIAAVFGMSFMLLFIPLQMYLSKKISVLRLKTSLRTDKRMRMMTEIISGIQVIKMYAWELPFERMVSYAREKEINTMRYMAYIKGLLSSFNRFLTRVSIFISLVLFVLLGKFLTAEVAFLITAYYNVVRTNMTAFFPLGITQTAETLVSIRRVQKFLLSEEVETSDNKVDYTETGEDLPEAGEKLIGTTRSFITTEEPVHSKACLSICGLKAKWDTNAPDYTLSGVNLKIHPGTLLAIVGHTGSGKSSLIQAVLGELRAESGEIKVNGSISYASQEPWLFSGTVRQNILFGQPMDRRRYYSVVRECALERDFELLPLKDKTIVGDRGASLSGGQKARISLARAVYREASIYLLDDPLSAVDSNVARHLFEHCMRGYLRNRIVILATHQLQFLQQADQIVIMDKGQISAVGTYEELLKSGADFGSFLDNRENPEEPIEEPSRTTCIADERRSSVKSALSNAESCLEEDPKEPVINLERKDVTRSGLGVYTDYFKAAGGLLPFVLVISVFLCAQGLASLGDYFLSPWVSGKRDNGIQEDPTIKPKSEDDAMHDIYIFTLITVLTIVVTVKRSFLFYNLAMKASIRLHNSMFRGISRASMYFFNTNPSGGILNRFSKDMGQVDEVLPIIMMTVIQDFLSLAGNIVVISIVNPVYLIPALVIGVVFYHLRTFYLQTSRDVKRLEASTRSPVYSHFAASLTGLSTIRAFGAESILEAEFDSYQDMHSSAAYMFISTSRAFGYWIDVFCMLYLAIVTLGFFMYPPANGAEVGLAITQAIGLTGTVQWTVRQSAELETTMISVERVIEYEDIEPEGELEAPADKKPPQSWPEQGKIEFDELSLRYTPDPKAENVLKSLSFVIKPREKIGIVGRTGAGKSSLINALFRLSYNDGSVLIDKRDTNEMGLHDLRSKISIIPQEPVLFSGTMRYNLDPFEEYSDEKLWLSLEEVQLKEVVANMATGLETKITEGGSNFSVGQRQLVCLARAILRENKILVMDEATANVDPQTDALIQATIRNKFKDCTVLTIAHRLHTIMDSDKVLVMDAGRAVEFGTPYELLTAEDSNVFLDMVKQTGQASYDALQKIAQRAFEEASV